jgi:exopolyphosphatase/guanosine-5'-triphosphate,3'-diphosphate pyrophosphatase
LITQELISGLKEEVEQVRARYDEEPSHSSQVEKLAGKLFAELARQKAQEPMGPRERMLLGVAALLHDIGWSQTLNGKGHHKESAKLIMRQAWTHLAPLEVRIVAQVARYHRKALPKASHTDYMELPEAARRTVRLLGGILRIADALDRTHTSVVQELSCQLKDDSATVKLKVKREWTAEKRMFSEKRDLLELVLERPLRVSEL